MYVLEGSVSAVDAENHLNGRGQRVVAEGEAKSLEWDVGELPQFS